MGEETTRDLTDNRSFEERVFARFDAMDARLSGMETRFEARFDAMDKRFDAVEARLDKLDARVQVLEAKAYDTKPIWELALAEILIVKASVENIERRFEILTLDMMQLRGDQRGVHARLDELAAKPA